jgi:hypothetical protein
VEIAVVIESVEWRTSNGPWQSMLPHPKMYSTYSWDSENPPLVASALLAQDAVAVRCIGEISLASTVSTASRRIPFEWVGR